MPCLLLILNHAPGSTAFEPPPDQARENKQRENREHVDEWTQKMRDAGEGNRGVRIQPGIMADRDRQQVQFWAETTGIEEGHAVEFVLISQRSGHDYEALAVSMAEPSAIHEALEFIGMTPGKAVDPANLRFWPRGERAWVVFDLAPAGNETMEAERVYAETLLFDQRRQGPLPVEGFVFTGSTQRTHPGTGEPVYAADNFGPHAIVSLYNEPFSVMDVPRLAPQTDVYGSITPNPDRLLPADSLIRVTLKPETLPQQPRVFAGRLHILPAAGAEPPFTEDELRFTIEPDDPHDRAPTLERGTQVELLAWLGRLTESDRDPFLVMRPDASLPWSLVKDFYTLVHTLEGENGIRVEPPEDDRLYHRAFLPADWFRDRQRRPAHPDELHLPGGDTATEDSKAVWMRFEEEWPDPTTLDPILHTHETPVTDVHRLLEHHAEDGYRPSPAVLLVFAPDDVPLQSLHGWMLPLRETYPTQYLFAPEKE